MPKRFNLVLDDDLYDDWVRFYGAYGMRQTILRHVVKVLVNRAKLKSGILKEKPILWDKNYENMTLSQIVEAITEEVTEHGDH